MPAHGVLKLDHIGIIVEDLEAAERFFIDLGLKREGGGTVEGAWVDAVVGLEGVRNEMMRTPDGHGRVELIRVDAPPRGGGSPGAPPPNRPGLRTVAFEVAETGTAPVTRSSGRSRTVRFRYAANKRMRHAIDWWAFVSVRENP